MENYQMLFLGSPSRPPTSSSAEDDRNMSNNARGLFAHFHGGNIGREVKEVLEFGIGHVEASYSKFGDETGASFCGEKIDKAKSGTKQGEKNKRHKFAFQTRSQVDVLDDGYRWRKYGQKTVKNSKFPRSYYKCTYQGCNVKKQIQRLCKDEGIVVTTYEGMHSHSIERSSENFDHILKQIQTSYTAL